MNAKTTSIFFSSLLIYYMSYRRTEKKRLNCTYQNTKLLASSILTEERLKKKKKKLRALYEQFWFWNDRVWKISWIRILSAAYTVRVTDSEQVIAILIFFFFIAEAVHSKYRVSIPVHSSYLLVYGQLYYPNIMAL